MVKRMVLVLFAFGALSACAHAQAPELKLPTFDHLRAQATESVDFSLSPLPLQLASWFIHDDDPNSAAVKNIFSGLHGLHVMHYEFAADNVYSRADIEAVRAQLAKGGWTSIARVRDQKKSQDVDVYLAYESDRITGLTIVASEPRQFTIVHASGSFDMKQVDALRMHFDLQRHDPSGPQGSYPLL
jgi:hypothetical protein